MFRVAKSPGTACPGTLKEVIIVGMKTGIALGSTILIAGTLALVGAAPAQAAAWAAPGAFVETPSGQVFYEQDHSWHLVINGLEFRAMGGAWWRVRKVRVVPGPIGKPLDLVRVQSTGRVYDILGVQAVWIPGIGALQAGHWSGSQIAPVSYLPIPLATPTSPTTTPAPTSPSTDPWATAPTETITWYTGQPNMGIAFPLPTENYTNTSNPDGTYGWDWSSPDFTLSATIGSGTVMSYVDAGLPDGSDYLAWGGSDTAYGMLWKGPAGNLHLSEWISLSGTLLQSIFSESWRHMLVPTTVPGDTLVLNYSATDGPGAEAALAQFGIDWYALDTASGARLQSQQPPGLPALPSWELNPSWLWLSVIAMG